MANLHKQNVTFKSFLENIFGDDFDIDQWRQKIKARGSVVDSKITSKKDQLTLYHGFNRNPETFNYLFDPSKSEQGLLWFTHNMIRGYDPYQYAASRGKYVLTYPLKITKTSQISTYEDGSQEKTVTDEMRNLATPTENSRHMVFFDSLITLPKNWFFTYKTEKFIGTTQKIQASVNMIKRGSA